LIFCNELEAKTYANTNNVNEAFNILTSKFKNIAMTMGAEGSLVKWDNQVYEIPAYKTKAIDTTGAGDMYAAGFMYGITHAKNPVKAGHLGSISASKVVSQYGARLTESHTDLRDMIFALDF
jgi:sugar/nucleoside kinase (ribokinase family)